MQFFMHNYGATYFPVSAITKMRKATKDRNGREYPAMIYLTDDREYPVHDRDIDRIVRQSAPVIPALPGFELLEFRYDAGGNEPGPWIHREPIIGWRDGQYGGLDPVIIDYDYEEMGDHHGILQRGGQIHTGEQWFDTEAEWVACMKARADDEHARKQAIAAQADAEPGEVA